MDSLYLTTAIPFVNGAPHLGHALEYLVTDVLARDARRRGRPVRFLTGTDEHAAKNARAALAEGREVGEFVATNAARFRTLADVLDVTYDDFLRTSADARHRPAVEWLWERCAANGDLYRATYGGWYCGGCEQFVDGGCDEHPGAPEWLEEPNWYFRLSKHATQLRTLVESGELEIVPAERAREVLAFLDGDVRDLSVSRDRVRARGWGIPVPGDPSQLVYVWFDALANYVSALGLGGAPEAADYLRWWCGSERVHVIGKGILRFHAVIWPAILLSAGQPVPRRILVHDYVTVASRKIGKSLGNTVDPAALAHSYGVDALRWWLAADVARLGETDFTEARLVEVANRDLAHGFGNVVQRVATLAARDDDLGGAVPSDGSWPLLVSCCETDRRVDAALARFDLRGATLALRSLTGDINQHLERTKPWALDAAARAPVVAGLVEATRRLVDQLEPFTPALAARARLRLGTRGELVHAGPVVAPRLEPARS